MIFSIVFDRILQFTRQRRFCAYSSGILIIKLLDNSNGLTNLFKLSQYADPKRLLIDAGALALSKDTGPSSANAMYGIVIIFITANSIV